MDLLGRPVAPVSRNCSNVGKISVSASCATASVANGGGLVSLAALGAPSVIIGGRGLKICLPFGLMEYCAVFTALTCEAWAKFGPGRPLSSMMPLESRLEIVAPCLGL